MPHGYEGCSAEALIWVQLVLQLVAGSSVRGCWLRQTQAELCDGMAELCGARMEGIVR